MQRSDVETLEKVSGQIQGLHREISLLAKKSNNDGLNVFKLRMLNAALTSANAILAQGYKPIDGFEEFDLDDVPSNSDATLVLTAYLEELERYRADNIVQVMGDHWKYVLNDGEYIRAAPPKKIRAK
ncbi:hypothetical protein ACRARG_06060 [Pseudooceanicola sp. C21-150M6]|uniref:hypothetical protein n=1 Tax=Pseudooceanicola sp. C21-150M6 TaxID=3434355 RepID=UPI003D7FED1D